MIEIEKPKIETEILSNDGTYGKFVVEPLERGFAAAGPPAAGQVSFSCSFFLSV